MADDITPTLEDLERDLRADLETLYTALPPACLCLIADAAIRRALAAEAEVGRLRGIVNGLADRVVAQSELLGRRAERKEVGGD